MAGLALGLLGYRTVNREARQSWLTEHSPPQTLWQKTLAERGYVPVTDQATWIRVQAELPLIRSGEPRIWILESHRAIYLVAGQDPLLYSLGSKAPPSFLKTDWEPLGYGWDAYEAVLALEIPITHALSGPLGLLRRVKAPPAARDPREIQY